MSRGTQRTGSPKGARRAWAAVASAVVVAAVALVPSAVTPSAVAASAPVAGAPVAGFAPEVVTTSLPPVAPEVTEVEAEAPAPAQARSLALPADVLVAASPVSGFATAGVVWDGPSDPAGVVVAVRTAGPDGAWSDWLPLELEPGPAATGDGGTAPVVLGEVDRVEAKVLGAAAAGITGVRLAVIDPGTGLVDALAALPASSPAGYGAVVPAGRTATAATPSPTPTVHVSPSPTTAPVTTAPATTARPTVNLRAAWGADESLRTWRPQQGTWRGAVIHHTAGSNNYTAAAVPGILRGIYTYHAVTRGWGDIGYNFLVDRFGRIWEGRFGGIEQQTIGAHTLNWNTFTLGVSVIGNFETATVPDVAVDAVVRLLGWRFWQLGLRANGQMTVNNRTTSTIVGHREVGSTTCPGASLFARMPTIRTRVAAEQARIAAANPGATPTAEPTLRYRAHVQNIGWQAWTNQGGTGGTSGRALRVEALQFDTGTAGQVECQAHVQNIGWTAWSRSPSTCGTSGQGLRVEAMRLRLTGDLAATHDLWYRLHVQDIGWMGWTRNGTMAGTEGLALRVEAVQAVLRPRGSAAPGTTARPSFSIPRARYRAHVQNVGWQNWVTQGATAGTSGRSLRVEALNIENPATPWSGQLQCQAHVQNVGWTNWVSGSGATCGTSGRSLRVEGIRLRTTGDLGAFVDVWYRAHVQNIGWMPWTRNGGLAGTTGRSLRVEAIQVLILHRGAPAPR